MTDIQTPDVAASADITIGGGGFQTEHALALIALGVLALLITIRFSFPTP